MSELDIKDFQNRPDIVIKLLRENISNIKLMKNLDFLFDETIFDEIYKICSGNYTVNNDSPIFIRKNFKLVKEALRNSTLSADYIIYSQMTSDQKRELIDICVEKGENFYNLYNQFANEVGYIFGDELYLSLDSKIEKLPTYVKKVYFEDKVIESNFEDFLNFTRKLQENNPNLQMIIQRGNYESTYTAEKLRLMSKNIGFEVMGDPPTYFSRDEAIEIETFLDLMTKDIRESSMSPYEKYQSVYHIVTNLKSYCYYNYDQFEDRENMHKSRDLYSILSSEWIVCIGYRILIEKLCNSVGIPNKSWKVICNNNGHEPHARMYVNIVDEKYNIDGYYMADPTFDAVEYAEPYNKASYKVFHSNMTTEESHMRDPQSFNFSFDKNILNDEIFTNLSVKYIEENLEEYEEKLEKLDPELFKIISTMEKDLVPLFIYGRLNKKLNNPIDIGKTIEAYENIEKIINKNSKNSDERLVHNEYVVRIVEGDKKPYLKGFEDDLKGVSTNLIILYSKPQESDYPQYNTFLYETAKNNVKKSIETEHFTSGIDIIKRTLRLIAKVSYEPGGYCGYNSWGEFALRFKESIGNEYEIEENGTFNLSVSIPIPEEVFNMDISNATEYLKQLRDECLNNFYNQKNIN